jgi:hypothetical protein
MEKIVGSYLGEPDSVWVSGALSDFDDLVSWHDQDSATSLAFIAVKW